MKKALLASFLLTAAGLGFGDELLYGPEEELTITHTFLAVSRSSLVSVSLELDGELVREVGEEELEGALDRESTELIQVSDEISAVEDGRAIEFTRSFVELLQESEESSGDQERSTQSKSNLEGISVDYSWDEAEEDFQISFSEEGTEVDEELLSHLTDDVDLRFLLPEGEVDEGDTWELEDAAAYLPLMWPSGYLGFHDESLDGFELEDREGYIEVVEGLQVTCSLTYEGQEEREGVQVALISVSMEIETGTENEIEPEEGPAYTVSYLLEREIEGELVWDMEHDHLFSASFEGDVKTTIEQSASLLNPETEEEVDFLETKVLAGTITYTISVERE